jgi:type II secretory pathway pseudopilin PulG
MALSLMAIVAAAAWGWLGTVTRRDLVSAASLLESDLRLAQQEAVATAGSGPRSEVCLRPDGYDVYQTAYGGDPLNVSAPGYTVQPGPLVKSVRVGRELASGLQIIPPGPGGTVGCTAEPGIPAVAFGASGAPVFQDGTPHGIMVALRGQSLSLAIQPLTDAVQVGP